MRPGDDGTWSYRLEWYPPGEGGRQRTQGLGRHLPADVEAVAHAAISSLGSPSPTVGRGQVATWADLLGVALAAWTRRGKLTGTPAPATIADYTRVVGVLAWATGPSPLPTSARALRAQAEATRDALLRGEGGTGYRASTTAHALRVMAAAWGYGVAEDLVAPLPWQRPDLRIEPTRRHIPTDEDARLVLAHMRARGAPEWSVVAFMLHFATAPRISELAALTVADVDLEAGAVTYGRHELARKTGERTVPLDAATAEALGRYLDGLPALAPDARVWPRTFLTMRHRWWPNYVLPAMREAGVTPWSPHAARTALSDSLAAAGVDPHTGGGVLGHSEEIQRAFYRRRLMDAARGAMAARTLGTGGGEVVVMRRKR